MRRFLLLVTGFVVLTAAACSRTNFNEKDLRLTKEAGYLEVEFKAAKSEQTVAVTVSSEDAEVLAYLFLADDKGEAINALLKGKKPRKSIEGDSGNEVSFKAKVPSGKPFVVLVWPVKPLEKDHVKVQVKVEGR